MKIGGELNEFALRNVNLVTNLSALRVVHHAWGEGGSGERGNDKKYNYCNR